MNTNREGLAIILKRRRAEYTDQIIWAERKVDSLIYAPLNINQFSALVSLCVDVRRINAASRIVTLINDGEYFDASKEFERWAGFRRKLERELFLRPALVVENRGMDG